MWRDQGGGLAGDRGQNIGGGGDLMDQAHGLTGDGAALCGVTPALGCGPVGAGIGGAGGAQGVRVCRPTVRKGAAQGADGVGGGPVQQARGIGRAGAVGGVTAGSDGCGVKAGRDQRLGGRPETGADHRAIRPEGKSGSQTPAIGDATSGQQQRARGMGGKVIGQFGDKGQRAATPAMAPGLTALGHNHPCPGIHRGPGMVQRLALADQGHARGMDRGGKRAGVAKRQHHRARAARKSRL